MRPNPETRTIGTAAFDAGSEVRRHRIAGEHFLPRPRRELFDAQRPVERDPPEHILNAGAQVDALHPAGSDQDLENSDGLFFDRRPAIMPRAELLL